MPTIFTFAGNNIFLDFIAIFFAKYAVYLFVVFFLVSIFVRHDRYVFLRNILFSGFSVLLSFGLIEGTLAYFFPSQRPFIEYGFEPLFVPAPTASFPSSHATILFTLVAVIFLLGKRRRASLLFLFASVIVFARIYSGLHYPIDVFVGLAVGFFSAFLAYMLMPVFSKINVETET